MKRKYLNLTRKGFTLIELLVVIAIIGLLASIILASLNGAKGKAEDAKILSEIHQIQISLSMFYNAYGGYPGVSGPVCISKAPCSVGIGTFNSSLDSWANNNNLTLNNSAGVNNAGLASVFASFNNVDSSKNGGYVYTCPQPNPSNFNLCQDGSAYILYTLSDGVKTQFAGTVTENTNSSVGGHCSDGVSYPDRTACESNGKCDLNGDAMMVGSINLCGTCASDPSVKDVSMCRDSGGWDYQHNKCTGFSGSTAPCSSPAEYNYMTGSCYTGSEAGHSLGQMSCPKKYPLTPGWTYGHITPNHWITN